MGRRAGEKIQTNFSRLISASAIQIQTFRQSPSSDQYVWTNDGPNTLDTNFGTTFTLTKASVTVLRGTVAGLKY